MNCSLPDETEKAKEKASEHFKQIFLTYLNQIALS